MVVSPSRLAAESLRALPRKRLSRMMGRLADLEGPPRLVRRAVDTFARVYGVDLEEAEVPEGGFATFDDFFTRSLQRGRRPIDAREDVLVSPADGRLDDAGPIDQGATFRIKGRLYRVGELLGDGEEAAAYDGGTFALIYLAPPDYHRVHAPVSGPVLSRRHVDGTLFPVSELGVRHVPDLFVRNERVVVQQASEHHGRVATVLVGAIGVGRISLAFDSLTTNSGRPGGHLRYGEGGPVLGKGDELGMFHLGSTVIVLVEAGVVVRLELTTGSRARVGQALFRRQAR